MTVPQVARLDRPVTVRGCSAGVLSPG